MYLYHGTTEATARKALIEGIMPRGPRSGNWVHTVESNPTAVYLTNAYALYYAQMAMEDRHQRGAILEIDTTKLDQDRFAADEDALAQIGRHQPGGDGLPREWSQLQRTMYYRDRLLEQARTGNDHNMSLRVLGNCTYIGMVPPNAITRIIAVNLPALVVAIQLGLDPVISISNYKLCGAPYRNSLRRLFQRDGMEPDDSVETWTRLDPEYPRRLEEHWQILLRGCETIYPTA